MKRTTTVEKLVKHIKKDINTLSKTLKDMEDINIEVPTEVPEEAPLEASEAIPAEDLSIESPESLEENTTAPIE